MQKASSSFHTRTSSAEVQLGPLVRTMHGISQIPSGWINMTPPRESQAKASHTDTGTRSVRRTVAAGPDQAHYGPFLGPPGTTPARTQGWAGGLATRAARFRPATIHHQVRHNAITELRRNRAFSTSGSTCWAAAMNRLQQGQAGNPKPLADRIRLTCSFITGFIETPGQSITVFCYTRTLAKPLL